MAITPPSPDHDLLGAMAQAAAQCAARHRPGALRLARCDDLQLTQAHALPDIRIETHAVRQDDQAIVISAFATAARSDGERTTAATGRFTFTTLIHQRGTRA